MSYDRELQQICPHLVAEEALYVNPDRQTVRPQRPIAAVDSVSFIMNGVVSVPSYGVQVPGSVISPLLGPYTIITGKNDTFVYRVGTGFAQTVVVGASLYMTPQHLCALLNPQVTGIYFSVVGNQVQVRTSGQGLSAAFFIYGTSTLASYLGIVTNHEYRGRQVVPGWTLVTDPLNSLTVPPSRLIYFDQPLRSIGDFVELNYTTIRNECRRCGGTGIENDWRYGRTGEVYQVVDSDLLLQEIQKIFWTIIKSNPFHSWYGTHLMELVGKKLAAGNVVQNMLVQDIYTAFQRWQTIKNQQQQKLGQYVSDAEYPFRLLNVEVQQSTQDPTVIFINMTIQNRSLKQIDITRGIRIPQPTDLLGSTQQQALLLASLNNFTEVG